MNWRGLVALTLAAGVMIVLTAVAIAAIVKTGDLTEEELALFSTVLGAAIGAVATFLGVTVAGDSLPRATHDRRDRMTETEGPLEPGDQVETEPDAEPTGGPVEDAPDDDDETDADADDVTQGMGPGSDVT